MHPKIFIIIALAFSGCIKEIKPDFRNPGKVLVVEGLLLTDSTPCKVILSYTGNVNSSGFQKQEFIDDAIVVLKNTSGDSTQLFNQGLGAYIQADHSFIAKTGESYFISIILHDGSAYLSLPEKIIPVPKDISFDTVLVSRPYDINDMYGADIRIKTQDPVEEENYYRWIVSVYLPREATGVPCGFGCIMDQFCYQLYDGPVINILSDANINGNVIKNQQVVTSPFFSYGRHYAAIKQLSLTKQAYQFWAAYTEQTTRTGTILDPLPSQVAGNIYKADNPNDFVLGYFEASDAVLKKIIIAPVFRNTNYALQNKANYISTGACYEVYPNADRSRPAGFENAEEYEISVF